MNAESVIRWAARFHSLDNFAEPAAVSASAVGARTESDRSPDARTEQRITEHENKEMSGSEHRLVQLGRSSSFGLRSTDPAGMHSFGRRLKHARCHRPVALTRKNQPCQHPRDSTMRRDLVKAFEHALDVGFFRTRPSFEELRLKPADAAQDHRFNQPFAASEVMKNRGMRDAGVGGNFLKTDRLRTSDQQTALGSLQDRDPSLRRASTPSNRGPIASGRRRSVAPGANERWSRPGSHLPWSGMHSLQSRLRLIRRDAAHRSEVPIGTPDGSRVSP
jgi:hypothetical protein